METPEHIGPYPVLAPVARGGMGEVWRARHPTLDRDVAIKLVRTDLFDKPSMREMFQRELQALSRLRSPQTLQVMDAGFTESGQPYIVTEFLEGTDLHGHLKACGSLPVTEAVEIAIEVLRSLAEAHAIGLVHRDIKPANVFLQRLPGGGQAIKVLDFGVAKLIGGPEGDETLAGGSALKGSPRYMAPEQIRGTGVSAQTDLYAVGGLLYQMISGEAVFNTSGREGLLAAHLSAQPVSLGERCPLFMVPPALDTLILQCLRKNPSERPWGARELINELQRAAGPREVGLAHFGELGDLPGATSDNGAVATFNFDDVMGVSERAEAAPSGPSSAAPAAPLSAASAPSGGRMPDWLDNTRTASDALALSAIVQMSPAASAPAAPPPAPVEEEILELADVPGRRRVTSPARPPAQSKSGPMTPAATARSDDGPELQLLHDPRTIAEGQRRAHEFEASRTRSAQKLHKQGALATNIMRVLAVACLAVGGVVAWRHFRPLDEPVRRPPAPTPVVRTPPRAVSTNDFADEPAVARRGGTFRSETAEGITVGVTPGRANFIRVDTGVVVCTDAVECPMPLGVSIRVQRPGGGKGVTLPPMTKEQAAAGVVQVQLDR